MKLPFYFDYGCPWAYLGSCRVEAYFKDLGVEIDFRPMLLSIVREPARNPLPASVEPPGMGPRKVKNAASDLRHWADLCGAEFAPNARKVRPKSRLLAQGAIVAQEFGRFREYHYSAFRARWAEARNIADTSVVRELLAGAGLDADTAIARAQSDEVREDLDARSREAIEKGVFGAPTIFVGDEMFWGNDRFEVARHYIQKATD